MLAPRGLLWGRGRVEPLGGCGLRGWRLLQASPGSAGSAPAAQGAWLGAAGWGAPRGGDAPRAGTCSWPGRSGTGLPHRKQSRPEPPLHRGMASCSTSSECSLTRSGVSSQHHRQPPALSGQPGRASELNVRRFGEPLERARQAEAPPYPVIHIGIRKGKALLFPSFTELC